jgi:Fe-S-cluster formation regulator IscX/YfhJ
LKKILTIRPKKLTLQELSNFIMESLKDFNDIVQASFENVLCPPEDLLIITMKVMNSGGYYVPSAAIPFGLFKNKN